MRGRERTCSCPTSIEVSLIPTKSRSLKLLALRETSAVWVGLGGRARRDGSKIGGTLAPEEATVSTSDPPIGVSDIPLSRLPTPPPPLVVASVPIPVSTDMVKDALFKLWRKLTSEERDTSAFPISFSILDMVIVVPVLVLELGTPTAWADWFRVVKGWKGVFSSLGAMLACRFFGDVKFFGIDIGGVRRTRRTAS